MSNLWIILAVINSTEIKYLRVLWLLWLHKTWFMDHSLEQLKQHTQGVKENILSRAECDFWMFTCDYSLELQANSLGEPHQT